MIDQQLVADMTAWRHRLHARPEVGFDEHDTAAFDCTVRFIFQPAEEWGQGAVAMLDDGLLERFGFDEIWGIHNWPDIPVGRIEPRPGALMAAEDNFEIVLTGVGGHSSRPHAGTEVLVAASELVTTLQKG